MTGSILGGVALLAIVVAASCFGRQMARLGASDAK
jgi:hypothetical protein